MGLLICPDCGKQISDKVSACPFCGCPAEFLRKEIANEASVPGHTKEVEEANKAKLENAVASVSDNNSNGDTVSKHAFNNGMSSNIKSTVAGSKNKNLLPIIIGAVIVVGSLIWIFVFLNSIDNGDSTIANTSIEEGFKDNRLNFMSECQTLSYQDLARYDSKYAGQKIKIEVQIQQVINDPTATHYRAYEKEYGDFLLSSKEWYIKDSRTEKTANILEDDIIYVYGIYDGLTTVTRALTSTDASVPSMTAYYIVFDGEQVDVSSTSSSTPVNENEVLHDLIELPMEFTMGGNDNRYKLGFSEDLISQFKVLNVTYDEQGGLIYNVSFNYKARYASLDITANAMYRKIGDAWECQKVDYNGLSIKSLDIVGDYENKNNGYDSSDRLSIKDFSVSTFSGNYIENFHDSWEDSGEYKVYTEYYGSYSVIGLATVGDYCCNVETGDIGHYIRKSDSTAISQGSNDSVSISYEDYETTFGFTDVTSVIGMPINEAAEKYNLDYTAESDPISYMNGYLYVEANGNTGTSPVSGVVIEGEYYSIFGICVGANMWDYCDDDSHKSDNHVVRVVSSDAGYIEGETKDGKCKVNFWLGEGDSISMIIVEVK